MVKLWVKDKCFRCDFIEKYLDKRGIQFETDDLKNVSEEKLEYWRNAGHVSAPIIEIDDKTSSGADVSFIDLYAS